jgi:hypothetical protein
MAKEERSKLLDFAERAILDYWTVCQLLAGTIEMCVDNSGEVSYLPVPGTQPVKPREWPPNIGKDEIAEPIAPEKSGLYTAKWSGEHKAAALSGQHSTDWLKKHPEAAPRQRFCL